MKLIQPIVELQHCPDELFQYLKKTFIDETDWNSIDLLTKEEAFYDQSFRYEAITKYFNEKSFFFSKLPPTQETTDKIKPYTDYLMSTLFPDYALFRCQIVCLKPGQNVYPHTDPRYYHIYGKRIHLPLLINNESFHIHFPPEQDYDMKFSKMNSGIITDFDNVTPHAAFNYGSTNRIHIICDVVKKDTVLKIEAAAAGNSNATSQKIIDEYYVHLNKIEERYNCKHTELKDHYLERMPKNE
jgi:hypothetical protein